jgi:sulfur-oxidizing protein SoxY
MPRRREALKQSLAVAGLLGAAGILPTSAFAFTKAAFDAKTINDAIRAFGGSLPVESKDVTLTAPEIAENGAVVPMVIATSLPNVKALLLLVEKNPYALIAKFDINDSIEPHFSTRAKMAQTSDVYAVALTRDNKAFFAKKEVKVTLGGCGG